jgi:hypothetical protein
MEGKDRGKQVENEKSMEKGVNYQIVKGENNAEYHGRKTMEFKNSIPPTR